MRVKALFHWFHNYIHHYNLFTSEEDSDQNVETQQSSNALKQQKYSTWLYIFLFI
ncbi:unnamed protein product, partial [Adineta ricciae]